MIVTFRIFLLYSFLISLVRGQSGEEIGTFEYFRPLRTDRASMSPDGRHLAYTIVEGDRLFLALVDIESLKKRALIPVNAKSDIRLPAKRNRVRVNVAYMQWMDSGRLVYAICSKSLNKSGFQEEIRMVDADGSNDLELLDSDEIGLTSFRGRIKDSTVGPQHLRVLSVNCNEPDVILVEAMSLLDLSSEVFRVNVRKRETVSMGRDDVGGRILRDWQGRLRVFEEFTAMTERKRLMKSALTEKPMKMTYQVRSASNLVSHGIVGVNPSSAEIEYRFDSRSYFTPRAFPLAFGNDPNILYFASNVGRDTYGLYAVNLETNQRTEFAVENPAFDLSDPACALDGSQLVFDRGGRVVGARVAGLEAATEWCDTQFGELQSVLDEMFPGRSVDVLEWDDSRRRFLIFVFSQDDPGRYFVYQTDQTRRLIEIVRRAPGLPAITRHKTAPFALEGTDGARLTGWLTVARRHPVYPPALVIVCQDIPGLPERPAFNPEVQALAEMGFDVAQIAYRGASGFGSRHRDIVTNGFDTIPIDDIRSTIAWLVSHHAIDAKRIVLLGKGFGGYIAVRTLQLHPNEFRCAVCLDAPFDFKRWIEEGPLNVHSGLRRRATFQDNLKIPSMQENIVSISKPVLVIEHVANDQALKLRSLELQDVLTQKGRTIEYLGVFEGTEALETETRTKIFDRIGHFFNEHLNRPAIKSDPEK